MPAHDSDAPAWSATHRPARVVPASASPAHRAGPGDDLLRLQRLAGNAAVTSVVNLRRQGSAGGLPAGLPPVVQRVVVLADRVYSNKDTWHPDENTIDTLWPMVEGAGATLPLVEQYEFVSHRDAMRQQLAKWVDDTGAGATGGKHHPVFGRKAQHHKYRTVADLTRGLLGWVKQKLGRRQEKALARDVYANPDITIHLDVVLAKVKQWIDGSAGATKASDIYDELRTSTVQGAAYGTYQTHLDGLANADAHTTIKKDMADVLEHPEKYRIRDKVVVLHDLMEYFAAARHGRPGTAGTGLLAGAAADKFRSTLTIDASGKRVTDTDSRGMDVDRTRVITTRDESDETTKLARKHNVPVWVGQSFTTANMLNLAQKAGSTTREMGALAWAVFAFWRLDFDHTTQLGYHTLHEVMDIAQNFGVPYNMLHREAGLDAHSDLLPSMNATVRQLVAELDPLRAAATALEETHADALSGSKPMTGLHDELTAKIKAATEPLLGLTTKSKPEQQAALRLYALHLQEALGMYQVLCGFVGRDDSPVSQGWAAKP